MSRQLDLFEEERKLRIPRFTESPRNSDDLLDTFLKEFYDNNSHIKRPRGLMSMSFNQKYAIYYGLQKRFGFSEDGDVVPKRRY